MANEEIDGLIGERRWEGLRKSKEAGARANDNPERLAMHYTHVFSCANIV